VLERQIEAPTNVVYGEQGDRHLAYMLVKRGPEPRHIEYSEIKNLQGRWSDTKSVLEPGSEDDVFGQVRHNSIQVELHNMCGFPHGGIYNGILGVPHVTTDFADSVAGQEAIDDQSRHSLFVAETA